MLAGRTDAIGPSRGALGTMPVLWAVGTVHSESIKGTGPTGAMTSFKERVVYWSVAIALVFGMHKFLDFVDWLKRKR